MKKLIPTLAALAIAICANAAKPLKIDLTPSDALPGETATLEVFLPKGEAKATVVMCPGRGYGFVSMENEGYEWVDWFNERGIATAILNYRLPHERHNVPLADCMAAITTVRHNAAEWHIPADKVGVIGFSAGGHLASTMATHYTDATRPDFQILIYPVITLDPTITHMGTRDNLIGKNPRPGMEALYSNELQVTTQTPPAFIFATQDDDVVPVENSIRYEAALTAAKVPAELHIYPTGGHGYGKRPHFKYVNQMLWLLDSWFNTTVYPAPDR